jgi:NAD(P)-dependent dehydrogenase (short-subunit alcohol dehydrogenase family)
MSTAQEVYGDGVAVVTGAGSGIGEGLARRLAALGATVVLVDVAREGAKRVAAEIERAGGTAVVEVVDVRDAAAMSALADRVVERFGPVRVLVNNAGVEQFGYLWDVSPEDWARIVDINVNGVFHGIRAFVPRMIADAGRSHVINVASVGAVTTVPLQAPYITTKHAVLAMTETLYQEIAEIGADVAVTAVLPGAVVSGIFEAARGVGSGDVAAADRQRAAMYAVKERAISADEAAVTILDEAATGEFYVVTQPGMTLSAMRARGEQLLGRTAPAPFRSRFVEATR